MLAIYKLFPVLCGKGSIKLLKIVWRCQHYQVHNSYPGKQRRKLFLCSPLHTRSVLHIFFLLCLELLNRKEFSWKNYYSGAAVLTIALILPLPLSLFGEAGMLDFTQELLSEFVDGWD